MISLKDWMECVEYKISEGSDYSWGCYGPNAQTLDSWDGEHDGVSSSIVFDTKTQTVYEASVYDYSCDRAYRLINPLFKNSHDGEALDRGTNSNVAWDGVNYTDLETDSDFIDKCRAIMSYQDYDTRVSVPIDLPREDLFTFMMLAHEKDVTLNELITEALQQQIAEFQRDPEGMKIRAKEFIGE